MKKFNLKLGVLAISLSITSFSAFSADLVEIFKQSEMHDPQLSAAKHTLEASTEGKKQAFSAFLPQVNSSFGKSFSKSKNSNTQFNTPPATYNRSDSWNVGLSQSLYSHANYKNYKISQLQILKSSADYDIAYQDFILRVAQSYFDVLAAKDNFVFSKAEEKAIARQLDQAEQRFEVGLAAITDVHEARAQFDAARAAVILANNQVEDANEALFEIAQKYYDELTPAPDDLDNGALKLNELVSYQDTGIELNPELISSKINSDIADKQIEVNRAGHYPTLSLDFNRSHSFSPSSTSNQFDPTTGSIVQFNSGDSRSGSNNISLSLSVPIYSGGKTQSQVRQSIQNHKATMDRYEQTRRSVIRQIRNAFHGTLAAKSSVEARKQAMISAQSGLEATEAGYEVGTRTIVDVLLSQTSFYQSQRDYSKAKYDYFIQFLGIKRASGNLTENDIMNINKILK